MKSYFQSQLLLFLIFLILLQPIFAQQQEHEEPYQTNTVLLPFFSYMPETSLVFGGLMMTQFKPKTAGPETRASQVIFSSAYTLNNQLVVELTPNIFLTGENWLFEGRHEYFFFPDKYWGVGALTSSDDELDVEFRAFSFQQAALKKMGDHLFAGINVQWSRISAVEFFDEDGEPYQGGGISGMEGSTLPGVGVSIRHDKRSSITWPTSYHYLEFSTMHFPGFLGATHPHSRLKFDARKYFDLSGEGSSILGFHFRANFISGTPPFQEYSRLGGREIMRGYYEGRFRDNNAGQIQAEWRQQFYNRLGFTVFAAAGEVWNRFEYFSVSNPKFSAGVGFRFDLNPQDTSNLRIDFGIGKHDSGLYITLSEAF